MEVCNAVQDVLDQYSVDGVSFQITYSEGESIMETMGEILNTLITGVILTMIVLFIFFGDLKASLIVGISMPLSILLAVILLNFAGYNIDLMTGSALIIAIGMIVDNSIVILESCMRAKEDGLEPKEAAAVGTSTMLMSILAGTLTTVVVYIPMAMAGGLVGMMTAPLSWTIFLTLICSFLSAVVVVPLAFVWLKPRSKEELITNRILGRFKNFYRRTLPRLLRHPGRVVSVGAVCFVAAILLMSQMEFVLMASNYDGSIMVDVSFRSGTKVEVMNERIQTLEDALLSDENFESVTLSISGDSASFTAYAVDNCGRSSEAAVEEYTNRFGNVPDMDVSVSPSGAMDMSAMMSSNSKDVVLLGDNLDSLREAAGQVEGVMTQVPGVIRIENPFDSSQSKGRIVIDSQKALAMGTSESAVAMQIYYLLDGLTATTVDYGDTEYDVILEYPEGKYDDITTLMDYPITTQTGQQVTLRDISTVEYITTLPTITRQDGQYSVTLTATTTDTAKYSAPEAIDAQVAGLTLPTDVTVGVGMMDQSTADGLSSMTTAILAGAFLVFLVMAIQFNSPRLSIMVMMCIPLSLIGSVGLVFLTGRPMSIVGLMGFLMLIGTAVNNGIYLVDGANQLRQTMPLGEALVEAGTTRLRPILMTTLTTVISMVPMMFSSDSGMSMMKDMAYVMVGGLIASTILAMFLMPAFYLLIRRENLDGTKKGRRHKQQKIEAGSAQS